MLQQRDSAECNKINLCKLNNKYKTCKTGKVKLVKKYELKTVFVAIQGARFFGTFPLTTFPRESVSM